MPDTFDEATRRILDRALTNYAETIILAVRFKDGTAITETRRGKPSDLLWAARNLLDQAREEYEALAAKMPTDSDAEEDARDKADDTARIIADCLEQLPDPMMDDDDDGEDC